MRGQPQFKHNTVLILLTPLHIEVLLGSCVFCVIGVQCSYIVDICWPSCEDRYWPLDFYVSVQVPDRLFAGFFKLFVCVCLCFGPWIESVDPWGRPGLGREQLGLAALLLAKLAEARHGLRARALNSPG